MIQQKKQKKRINIDSKQVMKLWNFLEDKKITF